MDEQSYYGQRLSSPESVKAWRNWIAENELYAYFKADSQMNIAKLLHQGNAHRIEGNSGLDLAIDHARVYRQKKTGAVILLSHYYDFAEESFKKVLEYCKEHDLVCVNFKNSWYYPGVAHAFALVAKENYGCFKYYTNNKQKKSAVV